MFIAQVSTSWVEASGERRPVFLDSLLPGDACWDVTGQPSENITPAPNVVVWEVVCADATLTALEARADTVVLWSEEIVDG